MEGARRVAVFNHFDLKGRIHDYVIHYVECLQRVGFAVIFVSNSPKLKETEVALILPHVALAVQRRNVGWDFGAYLDGMNLAGPLNHLEWLLFTNDSVYGPLFDLEETLKAADDSHAEMFGITDNWDRAFHLQTYFILFNQKAIASEAFRRFWRQVVQFRTKDWVIKRFEIGLTRTMVKYGLRCRALVPYRTITDGIAGKLSAAMASKDSLSDQRRAYLNYVAAAMHAGIPLNPTHYFWDTLIASWRCPFLKRDLVQRNPVGIPEVGRWEEVVRNSGSTYDTDLIVRHLEATMTSRVY